MARGGINKAIVQRARQALLDRGEHPSIDAVRVELGNTGSKTTIHRYLKELDDQPASALRDDQPLNEQLAGLVNQLAEQLAEQAQETVSDERAELARDRLAWQQRLQEAEQRIQQLGAECEALTVQLQAEQLAHQHTREEFQRLQVDNARALQASQDLQTRVLERDEHIRSLEEKHQHARDALQHYREASKERREQEERRHAAEVQHLQMEMRQLQQTLIVKQDELTRLNRDNERLTSESGQLRRENHARQDALQRQTTEMAELKEQLTQALTGNQVLQARLEAQEVETQRQDSRYAEQQQAMATAQAMLHEERLEFYQRHAAQRQRLQTLSALLSRASQALSKDKVGAPGALAVGDGALLGWLSEAQSLLAEDTSSEP
ncbi:DNA-binding protein [Pseudomonas sp.]|uniref:DNA-binding protein n=1 Tax=Pseudomonas sp. TaxID=306 RepID=UPI0019D99C0F|nr:DNA-binding protein [Pseudomonas sp.]MBF0674158.1 DNA-binding protein [Pseudomonas sp.]